ncbi:tail fiber protein [Citrobacter freundii]|nr:tail fiber protein [Citrobacter freundii]
MFHVDNSTGVPVMPQPSPVTSEAELFFTEGGNGVPPTYPGPDWFNIIQSELLNIVRTAGISPDKMDSTQLLAALGRLFLKRNNPFGDIAQDGPEAIATALSNLGLGEGSALPVGVPVPWPSATPPTGWLKCNGADFSAEEYPELAKAYPTNKLPNLRGEFIRGWDDGRGVDSGRTILSLQGDTFKAHDHYFQEIWGATGSDGTGGQYVVGADNNGAIINLKTIATNAPGGSETRPRNIAFNYIVRAV